MINDCAALTFVMSTLMMTFSTLAFCKVGKKSCADAALLSLVGIGVGVVGLISVFPGFQHMIQHLPVIQNIIGNNGIIALIVDCLALAATATLTVMASCGPLKIKKCSLQDLYKCFFIGLIVATGAAYLINSGCMVKHNSKKVEKQR